ncbi:MAG: RNB domain-containing ribonuclease, partial [Ignavibacteria bacterium]
MKKRIKALFQKNPGLKLKSKNIAKRLNIRDEHEYHKLKSFLHQLVAEDFLAKSGKRFYLNAAPTGKIIGNLMLVEGARYGFVTPQNFKMRDIFIPERFLHTAFDGDVVECILLEHKKGKNLEGQITKVVERKREEIVGTLHKSNSFFFVIADEEIIHRHIYISANKLKGAKDGDKVVVQNIRWEDPKQNPEGEITEVLGKSGTYDVEIAAIAREFGIEYRFPTKVLKEANKISEEIPKEELKKRIDLRKETIFTIDPEDAKDFDDAVSIKTLDNGNYYLGVHIADVSHYVQPGSQIFKEALKRGTSTYLVGKVIPMLPEKLSNNICSLVPNKDRLAYSVFVELTPRMKIVRAEIKKSVINSCRRFTYDEVQEIIENRKGEYFEEINTLNTI